MERAWRLTKNSTMPNSIVDYYDALSSTFDDVYFARGKFSEAPWNELSLELAEVAGKICEIKARTIADFGCGSGHWSRLLVHQCAEIHLVDASPSMLRLAQANFERMRLTRPPRYWVGDVLQEPIERLLPSNVEVSILGFVLSHYSEFDLRRIVTNVAERSERILIIDSASAESTLPDIRFKEHHVNGRWYSVPKRYEPVDHWLSVLSRCGLVPEVLAHTKHFFAVISRKV